MEKPTGLYKLLPLLIRSLYSSCVWSSLEPPNPLCTPLTSGCVASPPCHWSIWPKSLLHVLHCIYHNNILRCWSVCMSEWSYACPLASLCILTWICVWVPLQKTQTENGKALYTQQRTQSLTHSLMCNAGHWELQWVSRSVRELERERAEKSNISKPI